MSDVVAQSNTRLAGEFSNVRADQLPSHPIVPLGWTLTAVPNQMHQERENQRLIENSNEPWHGISKNVVRATGKASD